ncbi:sensor domain-containing protein [Streptomyces sp. NA04227]|uniref:sensor domain-containing protein n=1 Tax=Streptomyces sp. NA04227 TaxID=2742136 RepID=UPI0015919D4E|nr:sensor domain-containing protein [Streptomyces sp. NA04227]QKW06530.1 sensor domain-containing protein [Streptomyces sp. NA04227]
MTETTPPLFAHAAPRTPAAHLPRSAKAPAFGHALVYLLAGFPLSLAVFVAACVGVSFGLGTLVVWLGLPVLAGTLALARRHAALERRRAEAVTGRAMPAPRYRENHATGVRWMFRSLADPRAWADLSHMFLGLVLRTVTFSLALTWTVGGLGELLYGTWSWSLPRDGGEEGLLDLAFGISSRAADIGFHTGVGVLLLATAVPMVRGLVALEVGLVRALLTGRR